MDKGHSKPAPTHDIQGVRLYLSQPHAVQSQWIGQREILKQLLACWLVVDDKDLPLTPRLVGTPGIGKTTLGMAGCHTIPLAELLDLLHRQSITCQVQKAI